MNELPSSFHRVAPALPARGHATFRAAGGVARLQHDLDDGRSTTVYMTAYPRHRTEVRVAVLDRPEPLTTWCSSRGVGEALVGGYFTSSGGEPLGDLWTSGTRRATIAFDHPWGRERGCLASDHSGLRLAPRSALAKRPRRDLLQAGPLLVAGGRPLVRDGEDPEGFSAGSRQFDSDITDGRHPRAAVALTGGSILALACDGRSDRDAGLTLGELALLLAGLGADSALNLDGGGSASLVSGGRLQNRPRAQHGIDLVPGRPITTALVFAPAR